MHIGRLLEPRPGILLTFALLFALHPSAAPAQRTDPQLAAPRQHGAAVLEALRDKEIAAALKRFGEAADLSPSIDLSANDGLSAAAGGLYRTLMQLSSDERYDLLYAWSMPSETRSQVRILTTLVPQEAPPKEFARALRERPRDTSFPVSEIGGIRGLFSTGWMLVHAADDVGRLRRLTAELERLAEQNTPNADVLLTLARLADRRGDTSAAADALQRRKAALEGRGAAPADPSSPIDPSDLVLAAAALQHEELRPLGEEIFKFLGDKALTKGSPRLRSFLRIAHAVAAQITHGESGPEVLYENRLKYWVPASGKTAELSAGGGIGAMWLVHEDHILHLAGSGNDVLFLRYPLTGEFDFTCETQVGGDIGTEGGLVYGGLHFEALGRPEVLTVWDADFAYQVRRPCPFVRQEDRPTFNRVSIRSTADGPVFAANLHPMWFDGAASQASPWLGLRSFGDRRPIFRNLKITGDPVIPREVRMSDGDEFRGWQAGFFNETLPPFTGRLPSSEATFFAQPTFPSQPRGPDWTIQGGVIQASKRDLPQDATAQSLLRYQRPLLERESVSYEFHYQLGEYEVHPALGRLAFLIEPGGVRIHWITDGDLEWTGLPPDNATLEPLNRRGPRPLPLKENACNQVTLARADGKVTVSLNGELIYNRPVDHGGDLTFGLYRNAAASAVRVRNLVMTGDWPESLPEELLQNPATVAGTRPPSPDRHALSSAVGSEFIAENVRHVRREAARRPPADRYEFLARWVLPGLDHPDFRAAGEFTPTDPSPLAVSLEPERFDRGGRGGELVSPVFDLLDAAAETGKLQELQGRIAAAPQLDDESQRRARRALSLLVSLEMGAYDAAAESCDALHRLTAQATPAATEDMWPEILALQRGLPHARSLPAIGDMLGSLFAQRTARSIPEGCENWHARLAYLMERYRRLSTDVVNEASENSGDLRDWIAVRRISAWSRGQGYPQARWHRNTEGEMHHLSGHHEDYLFFRSPLRGNFEVAGEMGTDATTQIYAAGKYFGPRWIPDELQIGDFRQGAVNEKIDPPFAHFHPWIRFRAVFRDRLRTIYVNGRPVHSEQLPEHHDPWVGFRAWSRAVARLRNVQVAGDPQIPEAVPMSASAQLIGWVPYYEESTGCEDCIWRLEDQDGMGRIHGRHRPELDGSFCESILGYHRPLAEDGAVEYEFLYEPGKVEAHPAFDRLAFILAPEGVRIHWLTDGRYDRTDVPPDNLVDEPRNGHDPLPLTIGDWNHARISITGAVAALELNGQLVYQRELEPTNRRTFGLFHYADQTELRVRNVVMKGGWPRTLPDASRQELADTTAVGLDADLPRFKSVFTHDFAKDGLPDEFLKTFNSDGRGQLIHRTDGLHAVRPGFGEWTSVGLRLPFSAVGDFDFEASFDQLSLKADKHACILLQAMIDDEHKHECRLLRILHQKNHNEIDPSLSRLLPSGGRAYNNSPSSCEAVSGKLRVARRGEKVHYLFTEDDSQVFQLVGTHVVSDEPLVQEAVELTTMCNGVGETRVVWKEVTLRAEQLKYLPPDAEPQRALRIMDADGANLRHLTGPAPGFTHLGSPEWSRDGSTIVFDMSRGPVATSHIAAIDVDGGPLRELGPGCMPSFSRDGKQIVFSQPGEGVMTMSSDGSERKTLDRGGWGAQWSPDGKHIAYAKSGNITAFNVETRQQRLLLTGEASMRYNYVYWNLGWSHDSRWIAFRARNRNTGEDEVAVAGVNPGDRLQVLHTGEGNIHPDFTWSPDNRRVLFAIHTPALQASRLFWADRTAPGPPELLAGQPSDLDILNCAWSPDGRNIAFTSESIPQPLSWPVGDP